MLRPLNLGLEDKMHTKSRRTFRWTAPGTSSFDVYYDPDEFLILDEHTAALDPKTAEIIMELTDKIVHEKKVTTIMVTHNLRYAVQYGNRLIMMHEEKQLWTNPGAKKTKYRWMKL